MRNLFLHKRVSHVLAPALVVVAVLVPSLLFAANITYPTAAYPTYTGTSTDHPDSNHQLSMFASSGTVTAAHSSSQIVWFVPNGTSCTSSDLNANYYVGSGGSSNSTANGPVFVGASVVNPSQTTVYHVTCQTSTGPVTQQVTVTVSPVNFTYLGGNSPTEPNGGSYYSSAVYAYQSAYIYETGSPIAQITYQGNGGGAPGNPSGTGLGGGFGGYTPGTSEGIATELGCTDAVANAGLPSNKSYYCVSSFGPAGFVKKIYTTAPTVVAENPSFNGSAFVESPASPPAAPQGQSLVCNANTDVCSAFSYTAANNPPVGNLDTASCTFATGWAYDPDTTNQSINVDMYIDGTYVSRTLANGSRPDIQTKYSLPMSNYGFTAAVPAQYSNGNTHTLTMYAIDSAGGSNPSIGTLSFSCPAPIANLTASGLTNYYIQLGQPLTVSGTVSNNGTAPTTGPFTNLFVTNLDGSGTYWHTLQNSTSQTGTLGTSASAVTSTTFPAGTFTAPGTYAYDLCANYNSSWQQTVTESNGGDNCATAGYVFVTAPDLTGTPGAAISGTTNTPVTLNATIQNIGNSSTNSGFHNLFQVTLSDYATVVDNENADTGTLAANQSQAISHVTSYTFPTAGTYYYRACADNNYAVGGGWAGNITESKEDNNCSAWQSITIVPSSGAISATPNPCNVTSGSTCTTNLTWSSNVSNAQVWVSQNGAPAVEFSGAGNGTSPAPWIANGNTYDFTVYDYSTGSRGTALATIRITGIEPNLTAASGPAVTTQINQPVTLTGTVSNSGTGAAGAFPNVVHICDNGCGTLNTYVYGTSYNSMAAGQTQAFAATYTPTSSKQLVYQVCANEDTNGTIITTESNYGDNCGTWTALTVNPNIPAAPTNPVTTCNANGTAVSFSWTASPGATNYYPRMYAPTAALCNAFGWQVYTVDGLTCYPNPDNWTATNVSNFPVTPGQNYSWFVAAGNVSGVNWGTTPGGSFTCPGLVNLTAASGPAVNASLNQPVTITGTVSNIGNGAAGAFPNVVHVCDANCQNVNTYVYGTSYNSMAAKTSQPFSASYTPTSTSQLYYQVCADEDTSGTIISTESNYGDNCGAMTPLNVTSPNITAVTSGNVTGPINQPVTLSGVVSNSGTGTAGYFPNIIEVCDTAACLNVKMIIPATAVGTLLAGQSQTVSASYTPNTTTSLLYRVCGNTNSSFQNVITESLYNDNCGAFTSVTASYPVIGGSCAPSPTTGYENQSVVWTANPTGGSGTYTYVWGGNVSGTSNTVSQTYPTAGTYSGNVQVSSGGLNTTLTCSPNVTIQSCKPVFTANPSTIAVGQSTVLSWSEPAACASSCTISDGFTGGLSGVHTVNPPGTSSPQIYSITCGIPANTSQASINVQLPVATFTASPNKLSSGKTTTLTYSANNVSSCTITKTTSTSGPTLIGTPVVTGGSVSGQLADVVTQTSTYTFNCTSSGGPITKTAVVQMLSRFQEF